jgi:hypothetical protein
VGALKNVFGRKVVTSRRPFASGIWCSPASHHPQNNNKIRHPLVHPPPLPPPPPPPTLLGPCEPPPLSAPLRSMLHLGVMISGPCVCRAADFYYCLLHALLCMYIGMCVFEACSLARYLGLSWRQRIIVGRARMSVGTRTANRGGLRPIYSSEMG